MDSRAYTGNVGNVSVTANGAFASGYAQVYASAATSDTNAVIGGNIGTVSIAAIGAGADAYVDADASGLATTDPLIYLGGGNIGNASVRVAGAHASAFYYASAYGGGSVGTTTVNLRGDSAYADVILSAQSGGDVGAINITMQAGLNENYGKVQLSGFVDGVGGDVSKIGATTFTISQANSFNSSAYLDFSALSGTIGAITGTLTGGESGFIYVSGGAYENSAGAGGTIGNILLTNSSDESYTDVDLYADKTIGTIAVNALGAGSGEVNVTLGGAADVGAITINFGAAQSGYAGTLGISMVSGADADLALIKVTGGTDTSEYYVSGSVSGSSVVADSIAGVDFSLFNGYVYIDLDGVSAGTTLTAGAGGSDAYGTQGADIFIGGAGADTVHITGGGSDYSAGLSTLSNSNKTIAIGNADVIRGVGADDVIDISLAVDDASGFNTVSRITGGTAISTSVSAGAVNEYFGYYDSATGKFTSSAAAAASTSSTTDADAVLLMWADTTGGTSVTEMVVVVGVRNATLSITDGVITGSPP